MRRPVLVVAALVLAATAVLAGNAPEADAVGDANLVPIVPARLMDTRIGPGQETIDGLFEGIGQVDAGTHVTLYVAGRGGVADNPAAVMLNVTAVAPETLGFLTVYPCTAEVPVASHVNYFAGDIVPNSVMAKVSDEGTVCVYSLATTDVIVDVTGYVPVGGAPIPVEPARLLETRQPPGNETVDGQYAAYGRLDAGGIAKFKVWDRGEVPVGTEAVYLNVTAIFPDAPGFLTVYPCTDEVPETSNVNYGPGDVNPNAVLATVSDDGFVCIFSLAPADVIADVNAYVPPGGNRVAIEPARCADTRPDGVTFDGLFQGDGRFGPDEVYVVDIGGRCNIPDDATAAYLNVTAVLPSAAGFLTVWPCDADRPTTSNVNYGPGQIQPNGVLSKVSLDGEGQICIYSLAETDVIVDVNGYVPAAGLFGIAEISAGYEQTCSLMTDGAVWCWGEAGHLGDGTNVRRYQPQPTTITNATQVVSGWSTVCAVLDDGTARCWGENSRGQLGDGTDDGNGTTTRRFSPVEVTGLTGVTDISTWYRHSCAIADGPGSGVWCWGLNTFNELGAGLASGVERTTPIEVVGLPAERTAVDIEVGSAISCATLDDGTVWCWGNSSRTGGSGSSGPAAVVGVDSAVDLAVGDGHGCVVIDGGSVQCWGSAGSGQLGNGDKTNSALPVDVTGVSDAESISAGHATACVTLGDATAQCWGENGNGQAGDGTPTSDGEPTPVDVNGAAQPIVSMQTGYGYSCAVREDTSAVCWGGYSHWPLGTEVEAPIATPEVVGSGDHTTD
ncbi:MAG: hypothetical protein R8G01_16190 [Ilumatobacteraceae bacterium]|nr:hypothetical protein [Ilumatobacteraceae bacterium]